MKIKSLVSIVATSESARDRQLAIKNAWSAGETIQRRRQAIASQRFLNMIIAQGLRDSELSDLCDVSGQCEDAMQEAACC